MILRFPEFSREMRAGEEAAVADLLTRAYRRGDEAARADALRRAGHMAGEVVLPYRGGVVGYYALSGAPGAVLALGPVAIDPDWQGAGHGRRLIGMLSEWARLSGTSVIAEGPTGFLRRAGFAEGESGTMRAGPQ